MYGNTIKPSLANSSVALKVSIIWHQVFRIGISNFSQLVSNASLAS
jgi:hypothetical protein